MVLVLTTWCKIWWRLLFNTFLVYVRHQNNPFWPTKTTLYIPYHSILHQKMIQGFFGSFSIKKKQIIQNLCRKQQLDWRPKIQHHGFSSPITHTFWEFLSVFSAKPAYILKTYMQEFWRLGFFKELLLYSKKTCRGSGDKSDSKFWTFQLQNSNYLSSHWRNVMKFEL